MNFLAQYGAKLAEWWREMSPVDLAWLTIGMFGQSMFVVRWFIQMYATERAKRLVVPDSFWYASVIGSVMVLAYGLYVPSPVLVLGQFGIVIYLRNVYFIWKHAGEKVPAVEGAPARVPAE